MGKAEWHVLLWSIYVLSEILANMYHYPEGAYGPLVRDTLLSMPIILGAFYFTAYVLVPRYLQTRRLWLFIFFTLLVAIGVFWSRVYWLSLIGYLDEGRFYTFPPSKVLKNVIRDYSIIALAVCLKIIHDWYRKDRLTRELQQAKAEAEMQLLRAQLNPHFLFNTLNNLYGLALRRSTKTADSILKLSQILDFLLYDSNQPVIPLSKEVVLLRDYLDLEQLRYGERLQLELDIPEALPEVLISPLLLLPLVENAFKHGGAGEEGCFRIRIKLRTDASQLVFEIKNSKRKGKREAAAGNGGIGLRNLRQRLQLLYPGRHEMNIRETDQCFGVRLILRL
jgi:two-component system LytT family sensor kinase